MYYIYIKFSYMNPKFVDSILTLYTMEEFYYYLGINSVEIRKIWTACTSLINKMLISLRSWFNHHEIWTRFSQLILLQIQKCLSKFSSSFMKNSYVNNRKFLSTIMFLNFFFFLSLNKMIVFSYSRVFKTFKFKYTF